MHQLTRLDGHYYRSLTLPLPNLSFCSSIHSPLSWIMFLGGRCYQIRISHFTPASTDRSRRPWSFVREAATRGVPLFSDIPSPLSSGILLCHGRCHSRTSPFARSATHFSFRSRSLVRNAAFPGRRNPFRHPLTALTDHVSWS